MVITGDDILIEYVKRLVKAVKYASNSLESSFDDKL